MGALPKENCLFTYAGYKEWELDEGERYELIYGEAFAMSAPSDMHQAVLGELYTQFHVFLRGKPCKVRPAPYDVRLFYMEDESDDTVVQPDITVICDEKSAEARVAEVPPILWWRYSPLQITRSRWSENSSCISGRECASTGSWILKTKG